MEPRFPLADASHADLLLGLMSEFYALEHLRFDEAEARRALHQLLGDRAFGAAHLIRLGDETVGYLVLTFGFSLEFHGRDALLDELYLREPYRGRGIGRASLAFAEAVCRREGIAALHLQVERRNRRAQEVYRRAGYKEHDRHLLTKWLADD